MLLRKSRKQREYLLKLKDDIKSFCINFNKRYKIFPWSEIRKLPRNNKYSSMTVSINGNKYTIKEVTTLLYKIKVDLHTKIKPSYYNNILRAYIKESMNKSDSEISKIYDIFQNELSVLFKQSESDLIFCVDSLKEVNKVMKQKKLDIKPRVTTESSGIEKIKIIPSSPEGFVLESGEFISDSELLIESLMNLDMYDDFVTEASNSPRMFDIKEANKKYKSICSDTLKALKKKDYKNAKTQCKNLYKEIETVEKELLSNKNNISSTIISTLAIYIKMIAERLYVTFGCKSMTINKVLNKKAYEVIPTAVKTSIGVILANVIEQTTTVCNEVKKGKEFESKEYVSYINKIHTCIKSLKTVITKVSDGITEKEVEDKKAQAEAKKAFKAVAENAEFEHERLEIYEACQSGLITVEEREELLEDLRTRLVVQESIDNTDSENDSNSIKYNKIKEDVYEKCSNGYMTVEEREEIIGKAYDLLMVKEETNNNEDELSDSNVDKANKESSEEMKKSSEESMKEIENMTDVK